LIKKAIASDKISKRSVAWAVSSISAPCRNG